MATESPPPSPPARFRLVPRDGEARSTILRQGLDSRPLRDVYHLLLRVSWASLFLIFGGIYLTLNGLFAALYTLDPNAILHGRPSSYQDAFFFSVQTLATIGYGSMAPNSLYAHILVTLEALCGVLSFAIAAGLMFAKFSRPTARVLFSRVAVVCLRDGVPSLMFRMANERASHIVDAQLKVVLSRNETTLEGEATRRFHDMTLARQHSPLFSLTWTAVHPIDARSPMQGYTARQLDEARTEVVVTFVGLDEVTLQQVHARHSYVTEEILFEQRFVDIINTAPSGQRSVDYGRFHDVRDARA